MTKYEGKKKDFPCQRDPAKAERVTLKTTNSKKP